MNYITALFMKIKLLILSILISCSVFGQGWWFAAPSDGAGNGLLNGLISVWEFDETTGTTAYDSHINGYDGSIVSGTINQAGIINKSIFFNNAGYINFGNLSAFDFGLGDSFSISAWFNSPNEVTDGDYIFSKELNSGNFTGYLFYVGGDNKVYMVIRNDNSPANQLFVGTTSTITKNNFEHLVVTVSNIGTSASINFYINTSNGGLSEVTSNTLTLSPVSTAPVNIGSRSNASTASYNIKGYLDQIAVWNRVLTTDEILTLYNSGSGFAYTNFTAQLIEINNRVWNELLCKNNIKAPYKIAA